MSRRQGPAAVAVTDAILAALADAGPLPVSTRQVEQACGFTGNQAAMVYPCLRRLCDLRQVEQIRVPDFKAVYWRLDPGAPS